MEYLNVIEENFTKSDYVAYLRGSILKWLLEDKPLDLLQFKLYANKLAEIMDEPRVVKSHTFKLGDHVIVSKGTKDERTGTIVRLPRDSSSFNEYIVDLDDKTLGWNATVEDEGVSCKNAWYAHESNMIPLEDTSKALTAGKWYHSKDFTVEEL